MLKQNSKLKILGLGIALTSYFWNVDSILTQPSPILEDIQKTGLLKVAVRKDAVPFGYLDLNNQWTGICIDFIAVLKQQVTERLNNPFILVKLYESTLFNRFELLSENVVALECGPNTIRSDLAGKVAFSEPIFQTGTQFLVPTSSLLNFNPNGRLQDKTIGILRNTSNAQFLTERYPDAQFREFQGVTGRTRGVQALMQGKIDAFASDGILLFGEALLLNIQLGPTYRIIPKAPLDCVEYGLILPANDSAWQGLVNQAIALPETKAIYQKWVGPLLPALDSVRSYCNQQSEN